MPNVPVTLTPWFDAKDNPPKDDRDVVTDQGRGFHTDGLWDNVDNGWLAPQPSVWCDPSPPDMNDPLTVKDLRWGLREAIKAAEDEALLHHVSDPNGDGEAFFARRAARLRRALDAIGAKR